MHTAGQRFEPETFQQLCRGNGQPERMTYLSLVAQLRVTNGRQPNQETRCFPLAMNYAVDRLDLYIRNKFVGFRCVL